MRILIISIFILTINFKNGLLQYIYPRRHRFVNSYMDHYGANTAEDVVVNHNRPMGYVLVGNRYYRRGPPIYIDAKRNIISGRAINEFRQRGPEGPTLIYRNIGPEEAPDPTKIDLRNIPAVPANQIVYLRQPYIIQVEESSTSKLSSATDASNTGASTPGTS